MGLALSPATASSRLSVANRRLMAAHMFKPVKQCTGVLTGTRKRGIPAKFTGEERA
jgi:hypothetical protein